MVGASGLKTEVAVKLLRADIDPGGQAVGRLRDEARILSVIQHPAILKVHDLVVLGGRLSLVTEYVPGADLHGVIWSPRRPIGVRMLIEAIGQVAEALHAVLTTPGSDGSQPLELVHRDIKPSNIRLTPHGTVKLLDFGVAYTTERDRYAHTQSNNTVGSLAYMAPEQFKRGRIGPPTDVYALGCCLFEGLARRRLFENVVPVEMFRRAADVEDHDRFIARSYGELPPTLDPAVGFLLGEMLAYAPGARPTAGQVATRCEALAESLGGVRLRVWCRDIPAHTPLPATGSLDGRLLVEEPVPGDALRPPGPAAPRTSFDIEIDIPESAEVIRPSVPDDRRGLVAAGGITVGAVAMLAVITLLLFPPGRLEPPLAAAVPAQPAMPMEAEAVEADEELAELRLVGVVHTVELRSPGGTFEPGWIPADTYEVHGDFGGPTGLQYAMNVEVREGRRYVLQCDKTWRPPCQLTER